MELRSHTPYAALSWLVICFALLILVPPASTQSSFAFLQPLPTPVQCQTYAFAWTSGGTPPYNLIVSVSGNWGRAYGINGLEGQGVPWMIPVPAGYAVSFELFDNASHVATAGPLTIQSSDDTSCLSSGAPTSSSPKSTITSPVPTTSSPTKAPLTDPATSVPPTSEVPSSQPPAPSVGDFLENPGCVGMRRDAQSARQHPGRTGIRVKRSRRSPHHQDAPSEIETQSRDRDTEGNISVGER
ncbi:hypothetical protein GSI_08583 [Ganoderma sinense ZZ0214-1]|uniref:Uncharacterized protein n=1 Tax=Ganoderma sinense ZZ0214-1 TaxID=1077348 RepID=A0A2G8S448_9APHY|nr:hypothetical protein GSI_08583 [Ganoderma sinense ZZ0214-1]